MPTLSFASSRLVNPPGASPALSEEQVWKGLEIKARQPKPFIPVPVSACAVRSDSGNKMTRTVVFGSDPPLTEDIVLFKPTIAYFEAVPQGPRITNVLSYNENNELVLTFSFAGGIPGTRDDEPHPSVVELNRKIGAGVQKTIDHIRQLARDGIL